MRSIPWQTKGSPRNCATEAKVETRVTELDLLRFVAAVSVVFFHYCYRGYAADDLSVMPYPILAPFAKFGYLGVELFFMISGFVVLMSASGGSFRRFMISRFVRLYPAFWTCCTITAIVSALIGGWRFPITGSQYLINLSMVPEVFHVPSVDGVYWSLFVEIKFYIMVGAVVAMGQIHRAENIVWVWLLGTVVLDIFPSASPRLQWLLMTNYSPYFIGGALCYFIRSFGLTWWRVIGISIAALLSVYRLVAMDSSHADSVVACAVTVLFFMVMFLVAIGRTGWFGRSSWITVGALTYPLYLLHQNVGYMIFNSLYPEINRHILLSGAFALVLICAYGVNRYIERPISAPLKNLLNRAVDWAVNILKLAPKRAGL